jgi:hypothetical protein
VWPVDLQSCGLLEYSSGEKTKIGINGEPFICTYAELNCNLIHINRPFFLLMIYRIHCIIKRTSHRVLQGLVLS